MRGSGRHANLSSVQCHFQTERKRKRFVFRSWRVWLFCHQTYRNTLYRDEHRYPGMRLSRYEVIHTVIDDDCVHIAQPCWSWCEFVAAECLSVLANPAVLHLFSSRFVCTGNLHHLHLRSRVCTEDLGGRLLLSLQRMEGEAQIRPQTPVHFR